MGITKAQQNERKKHIGSSDLAAIVGVDPYKTAYDVWLEKTGKVGPQQENESMQAGNLFEDGVLRWASEELGGLQKNQRRIRSIDSVKIAANIDAIVKETGLPVEAKTAGLLGPLKKEEWGETGTDEIPMQYIIQAHAHMYCISKDECHVPVFLGGRGFVMFHVKRNDKLINVILDKAASFWDCVLRDKEPDNSRPSVDIVKRIIRVPGKIVNISEDLIYKYDTLNLFAKYAQEKADEAKRELLAALGDAEVGQSEIGAVTYKEQVKKEHTVKTSRFRVLRIKKGENYEQYGDLVQKESPGIIARANDHADDNSGGIKIYHSGKDGGDSPAGG